MQWISLERQRQLTAPQVESWLRGAGFGAVRSWQDYAGTRRYRGRGPLIVSAQRR
jgi:hypothetical protein